MDHQFSGRECVSVRPCGINRPARAAFGACASLGKFRRKWAAALALGLAAPLLAAAQGTPVPARVTDRVDVSRMATLKGNMHALAQAKYDQGAAPPDLPMNRMMLLLKRSTEQESALQDLLVQQQVTSAATFHKWLTPDQFGKQFGLADADIQSVTSWLASFGFQSIKVSKGRNVIEFSGTAAQVETALHTSIHKYVVNGENHWANSSDPQVPAALAPVISGFASLHDFHPKTTMAKLNRNVAGNVTSGPRPQINLSDGRHALVPADFNKIYNVGSSMTGSGVTIGIIASSNINVQDVVDFRSLWGLSTSDLPTIVANGPLPDVVPGSGGEGEAVLDATWAGAVAPAATVDLVVSEDTNAASGTDLSEFYIVDNNLADVMTESFQLCESQLGSSLSQAESFFAGMAEQAAAQGITFLVSSGDGGPDACDDPSTEPATITSPSVNILASTPFNVAVGGTMFNDIANPNTYWNPPTGTSSGNASNGGSALSYIPEDVWNESCTALSATCPAVGLWSSGGGQSSVATKPPWQSGPPSLNIPSANARFLPDVAMNAADHDGYILCVDGSCQGIGCPPPGTGPCFGVASGTSASVQVFGGAMALVVQKIGTRAGIANYALYKLAATETLASCNGSNTTTLPLSTCIFNDVTSGNTNVPGLMGFTAGVAGYDEATGLGSVNVTNLVNKWSTAIVKASTTTLRLNNGTAVSVPHGSAVPVEIMVAPVAPATGTPTGDVSLIANSSTDQGVDGFILSNGSVNALANNTILLPGGKTYLVHAHYEGDGTFLGSDSTSTTVTVTPEASEINFGIVVNNGTSGCTATSVPYGSSYVLTVDVSDLNVVSTPCSPNESGSSPTGTVTLTDSLNGGTALPLDGGTFMLNSFGYFEDQPIELAVGTHSIQAAYVGDKSFNASNTSGDTVTVTKATTTANVTPSSSSVAANTTFSLSVVVDTQTSANPPSGSTGVAPTGTVTFSATTTAAGFNPARRDWPDHNRFIVGEFGLVLACAFALLFATKLRRGSIVLGIVIVIAIVVGNSCGSGPTSSTTTTTTTLGTANLSPMADANGFAAATATLSNVKLATTGTITATYSGDGNYNSSTSPVVTVTIH